MDVEIKFEPSGQTGVVAAGSYVFDAARRMGIDVAAECERKGACDSCKVHVNEGKGLLSEFTNAELKHLSDSERNEGWRLSCQAKIERQGELVVMVTEREQTEEEKEAERIRKQRREFEELPLEKKVANLLELEIITLSETFSFVLNSPWKIFGKVMDVMAEFGLKMDDAEKKSKRPSEHEDGKPDDKTEANQKKKSGKKEKATEAENEAP